MVTYPQQAFKIIKRKGPMTINELLRLIKPHDSGITIIGIRSTLYAHARRANSLINISNAVVTMNDRGF